MTTHYRNLQLVLRGAADPPFDWREYLHENVIHSPWLALWLLALTYITGRLAWRFLVDAPLTTAIILLAWVLSLGATALGNILHHHTPATLWLARNLYSSITNALVTLLLVLLLVAGARGFIDWAIIRASFSTDPDVADATLARWETPGANWGAIIDNFRTTVTAGGVFTLLDMVSPSFGRRMFSSPHYGAGRTLREESPVRV